MIRFINKRKAKKLLKQVWMAHTNLVYASSEIITPEKALDMMEDVFDYADGMAELALMLGIPCLTPPSEWEV